MLRKLLCGIAITSFIVGSAVPSSANTIMFRYPPANSSLAAPIGPVSPGDPGTPVDPQPGLGDITLTAQGVTAKVGHQFTTPAPTYSATQTGVHFYTDDDLSGTDIAVNPSTGVISGTLAFAQTKSIDLSISDDTGRITTKAVAIEIVPLMKLSVAESTTLAVATDMQPITVTDLDGYGTVTWDPVDSSKLPPGVTFDTTTGQFVGKPTVAGTYGPITITSRDSLNDVATATVSIVVEVAAAAEMAYLDTGDYHTCSLTPQGGVKCWGANGSGQLGTGKTGNSSTPVDVVGLTSGVKAVSVGSYNNCAITEAGGVKCWGSNVDGQLGNNSTANSNVPVDVQGLSSGIVSIAGGDGNGTSGHTCAITNTGGLKCWGNNAYGQLGNGNTTRSLFPVDVVGLSAPVIAVTTGSRHTCAILDTGGVQCWGMNTSGQLGNGNNTNSSTPVNVSGLQSGVVAIRAGGDNGSQIATCAVTNSGGVKCWGSNSDGQLGNNSSVNSNVPVDVQGLTSYVKSIALGNRHACAATTDGAVKCWGWNTAGQLGNGGTGTSKVPVEVVGLSSGANAVATGYQHSCAMMDTGAMKCWGNNQYGQLGNGNTTTTSTPVDVKF